MGVNEHDTWELGAARAAVLDARRALDAAQAVLSAVELAHDRAEKEKQKKTEKRLDHQTGDES